MTNLPEQSLRILITGGTGFLGSHLTSELLKSAHSVTVLSRRTDFAFGESLRKTGDEKLQIVSGGICDEQLLRALVSQCDVIIHCAAKIWNDSRVDAASEYQQTNVLGTSMLLDAVKTSKNRVKKMILASSISVYGEGNYNCRDCGTVRPPTGQRADVFPGAKNSFDLACPHCDKELVSETSPEGLERYGFSTYATTKKIQEDLCIALCKELDLPLAIMRYSTVYGPGQSPLNPYSNFMRLLCDGKQPVVHEDGNQSRDFVFIKDAVKANVAYLNSDLRGLSIFNMGSGVQTTIMQFLNMLSERIAFHCKSDRILPTCTNELSVHEIRHCNVDCSAIMQQLDLKNFTSLADGLDETVQWYLSTVRKAPLINGVSLMEHSDEEPTVSQVMEQQA